MFTRQRHAKKRSPLEVMGPVGSFAAKSPAAPAAVTPAASAAPASLTSPAPPMLSRPAVHAPAPKPPQHKAAPPIKAPPVSKAPAELADTPRINLWDRLSHPVVLRVPPGVAAVLALALLSVLVLVYWVGHARGYDAARGPQPIVEDHADIDPDAVSQDNAAQRPPDQTATGGSRTTAVQKTSPAAPSSPSGFDKEWRQKGLNYMFIVREDYKEAAAFAEFLKKNDVDVVVVPIDNSNFYHVVGKKGFSGKDIGGRAYSQYDEKLHSLGRKWKAQGGKADASSMYPVKYEGP